MLFPCGSEHLLKNRSQKHRALQMPHPVNPSPHLHPAKPVGEGVCLMMIVRESCLMLSLPQPQQCSKVHTHVMLLNCAVLHTHVMSLNCVVGLFIQTGSSLKVNQPQVTPSPHTLCVFFMILCISYQVLNTVHHWTCHLYCCINCQLFLWEE